MRSLSEIDKVLVRKVIEGYGWKDLSENTTELVGGHTFRELHPAWGWLLRDGVIVYHGNNVYTTSWTAEDIARGYRDET